MLDRLSNNLHYAFPAQEAIRLAYAISEDRLQNGRRTFDVCYDIEKVFDRTSYKTSKKYNNHITRYLNYATNNELFVKDIETKEEQEAAYKLYQDWWDIKMKADKENPNHFEEHSERYKYCMDYTFEKKFPNMYAIGLFTKNKEMLAFQTLVFEKDWAFDLSNANSRTDYAYIAEVSLVNFLKYLKDQKGIKYYNFGETGGDLGLLKYKEKLPNFRIWYGKKDIVYKKSTLEDFVDICNLMNKVSEEGEKFATDYMKDTVEKGNVLCAIQDNKIIGIVECREIENKNLMTNLIVDPYYRGQGIAKALLDKLPKPFIFFCNKENKRACNFYDSLANTIKNGDYIDRHGNVHTEKWSYTYN